MGRDVLNALASIMQHHDNDIGKYLTSYGIRINSAGEKLEQYLKDAVSGALNTKDFQSLSIHQSIFSYLGNQNNPPDFIIRGGDAFEVKKSIGYSEIQLNSSPPKDRLHIHDTRISNACRSCESWEEKDLFYVMGVMEKELLVDLFFIHGRCYCAENSVYDRAAKGIENGVKKLIDEGGWEAGETNELGRINRVDPLGITSLRVRGMWLIKNPYSVFEKYLTGLKGNKFRVHCLMMNEKFLSYPTASREGLESAGLHLQQIRLPDPNNPARDIEAVMITGFW